MLFLSTNCCADLMHWKLCFSPNIYLGFGTSTVPDNYWSSSLNSDLGRVDFSCAIGGSAKFLHYSLPALQLTRRLTTLVIPLYHVVAMFSSFHSHLQKKVSWIRPPLFPSSPSWPRNTCKTTPPRQQACLGRWCLCSWLLLPDKLNRDIICWHVVPQHTGVQGRVGCQPWQPNRHPFLRNTRRNQSVWPCLVRLQRPHSLDDDEQHHNWSCDSAAEHWELGLPVAKWHGHTVELRSSNRHRPLCHEAVAELQGSHSKAQHCSHSELNIRYSGVLCVEQKYTLK